MFLGIFISCNDNIIGGVTIDIGIGIIIEDVNGNNLLKKGKPNSIDPDKITIKYLINGKSEIQYKNNLDCPKMFCIRSYNGTEYIDMTPYEKINEEFPISYIDWGNGSIDELRCHFIRTETDKASTIVCDKVWYNGEAVFPEKAIAGFPRAFKIIK